MTETSSTSVQHKRSRRLRLLPRCNARDNRRSPTKRRFSKSSLNLRRDKDGSFVCNNCGMFSTHPERVPSSSLSLSITALYNFNQRTRPTCLPPVPSPSPNPTTKSPMPVKPMHSQVIPTPAASPSPRVESLSAFHRISGQINHPFIPKSPQPLVSACKQLR